MKKAVTARLTRLGWRYCPDAGLFGMDLWEKGNGRFLCLVHKNGVFEVLWG